MKIMKPQESTTSVYNEDIVTSAGRVGDQLTKHYHRRLRYTYTKQTKCNFVIGINTVNSNMPINITIVLWLGYLLSWYVWYFQQYLITNSNSTTNNKAGSTLLIYVCLGWGSWWQPSTSKVVRIDIASFALMKSARVLIPLWMLGHFWW